MNSGSFSEKPSGELTYGKKELFKNLNLPKKGYVFLVTYGRSGSTLTSNYLNSFPGYCIRGENNNIIHHLCSAIRCLDNTNFEFRRKDRLKPFEERREDMQKIMETPKDPWYGAELVDPDVFAKTIFDRFVKEILSPPCGTRVSGFKEIRWANNLGQLQNNLKIISKYFPLTKFIFQTRDADSLSKSGWWRERPIEDVRDYVKKADAAFISYANESNSCLHIKYENLIKGDATLKEIAAFLEEKFCSDTAYAVINNKLTHLKKDG